MIGMEKKEAAVVATARAAAEAEAAAQEAERLADEAERAARTAREEPVRDEPADIVELDRSGRSTPVRSSRRVLQGLAITLVAGLILAGVSLLLALDHKRTTATADDEFALVEGARQRVMNLISPNADDAGGSAQRIEDGAAGQWLTEFQESKNDFVSAIKQSATTSSGEILGAGVETTNDDGSTSVLVTAVSKVSNSAGAKNEPRTWRLRVDVVDVDGAYKLSKVEVVP